MRGDMEPARGSVKLLRWSYRLGKLAGIDVHVHLTFLMLLAWIGMSRLVSGQGLVQAGLAVALVTMVFGIVVLHELGHALAARRFGIPTRDINLLPLGGVARLERMPEKPWQELVVAAAGPAVNLVLASIAALGLFMVEGLQRSLVALLVGELMVWLVMANLALLVFNLIPAFPMDGGRILRALLATRLPFPRATEIAVHVGRVLAVGLGLAGLFYNPMLVLVAIFVWMGGSAELSMVRHRFQPPPAWGAVGLPVGEVSGERVVFVPGPAGWRAVRLGGAPPPPPPPATTVRIVDIQ